MFEIIVVKPQREEDKLMEHEEARGKQTHSVIATLIGPIIAYNPMKFYYREFMLRKKSFSNLSKSTSWFRGSKLMIDLTHSHIWGPCTCILWLVRFFVTLWSATDSISWNLVVRISPIWKPKALHGKNYLPPLPSSTDQGDIMFLLNKNMNLPKKEESLLGGKRANETDYYSRYPV